jgi:hypothetical protein
MSKLCNGCSVERETGEFTPSEWKKKKPVCKLCRQDAYYMKTYGISARRVREMKEEQGDMCPICTKPLPIRFHVDHDHANGQVRGLLCASCNMGLGRFHDNATHLLNAAIYLTKHGTDHVNVDDLVSCIEKLTINPPDGKES